MTTSLVAGFAQLHASPDVLVLPNAWDAGTARLMQSLGAKAIATTSSGLAWVNGYADGHHLPIEVHIAAIRAIARVVTVPISVDAEGGYDTDPAVVAGNVARLAEAGAVGINLEDGSDDPELTCAKIAAIRNLGPDLFINARTDVMLRGLAPGREVEEILSRAHRYEAAGASGLFIPGVTDPAMIAAVVVGTRLPVNVMARPGLPALADLTSLGVRRLSAGGAIAQAGWGLTGRLAQAFLSQGVTDELFAGAMAYPDLNALMGKS